MDEELPYSRDAALHWLTLSAEQGNQYAQFFLDNMEHLYNPPVFLMASRLLHHMGRIFRENMPHLSGAAQLTLDRKLLRKLCKKKIAQGHAPDEYTQAHNMQL
jgi:TPR repeat protein